MNDQPKPKPYAAMLRDLATDVSDLHELAQRHKMTRVQMAHWAAKPRHSAMIDAITRLADRRTSLLLATGRAEATLMLTRIATIPETEARDVMRKACMDLIKLGNSAGATPVAAPAPADHHVAHAGLSGAALDAALDDLSRVTPSHHDANADDDAASEEPPARGAD